MRIHDLIRFLTANIIIHNVMNEHRTVHTFSQPHYHRGNAFYGDCFAPSWYSESQFVKFVGRTCMMIREMRAAIFDLDGVIVDTAKYHYLAWKRLAKEHGFDFTETDNERLKGVSRVRSLE